MVNKLNHLAAFILGVLFMAGCGNSKSFTPTQPLGGTAVSLSLTDTPPANVDVISFGVTVSGAAPNPGNIDLLSATGPQDIDPAPSLVALYCLSSDSQHNPRLRIGAGHSIVTNWVLDWLSHLRAA